MLRQPTKFYLLVTTAVMLANPARPQTAAGPAASESNATDDNIVTEIIVTAQKRAENIQNVPITMSAITADAATRAGARTTTDIPALVAGVTISRQTANAQIYIRGVGTQNVSTGADGSNPVYLDGFYNPSLGAALFALNSIERIEVLKGPQGTLFGRNATGGAINIITRHPSRETLVQASLGYGNYNTIDGSFYGTTGLSANSAIDLALSVHNQGDGFGTNLFNGQNVNQLKEYAGRTKFVFDPTADLKITLSADYDKTRSTLGYSLHLIPGASATVTHEIAPPRFYDVNENVQPRGLQISYGTQLRIDGDMNWAHPVSMSSYRNVKQNFDLDQDGSSFALVDAHLFSDVRAFTQEFQLLSPDSSRVKWVLGAFYLNNLAKSDPVVLSGAAFRAAGGSAVRDGRIGTDSVSGYAETTVPLGVSSNFTAGARYTYDEKVFHFVQVLPGLGGATSRSDDKRSWRAFTWRGAASHHFAERVMAYASISRGYKSGEFGIFSVAPPVDPETLTAYELGVKSELLDRRLRFNASLFHYDYMNVQLNRISAGGIQVLLNAASAKVDGLDVDAQLVPIKNLTLGAGASILFTHKYDSFPNAPGKSANPISVGGNTSYVFDASGQTMIQSPDATVNLNATYVIPTAERGNVTFSANYSYNSGFFWEPDHRIRQSAFGLLNGQLAWTLPSGNQHVRGWAKNLTGKKYDYYVSTSINDIDAPAPPRTFGIAFDIDLH